MRVADFHFDLPEELIGQHPPAERGASRMLVLERQAGNREPVDGLQLTDAMFRDLPRYLRAGDLLVLNDSRVLPARLFAVRAGARTQEKSPAPSGSIEVLLTEEVEADPTSLRDMGRPRIWRALVRPAKKVVPGETLLFFEAGRPEPVLRAEVVEAGEFGERTLRFAPVEDFLSVVGRIGHMPLPPYIRRDQAGTKASNSKGVSHRGLKPAAAPGDFEAEDRERYQTVYAHETGSAAAPTAGLHFTPEVLAALEARGVEIAYVTLHVGLGTFQPVRVERVEDIRLHCERYTLPEATADALNRALAQGRRVVAVGTTTTRTLEHIAVEAEKANHGEKERAEGATVALGESVAGFRAHSGETSIFISPGYRFRIVSGLLTNFHLPESTLLMLVSAFAGQGATDADAGRRMVLEAYAHAVRKGYRFYSYGDCMLVL